MQTVQLGICDKPFLVEEKSIVDARLTGDHIILQKAGDNTKDTRSKNFQGKIMKMTQGNWVKLTGKRNKKGNSGENKVTIKLKKIDTVIVMFFEKTSITKLCSELRKAEEKLRDVCKTCVRIVERDEDSISSKLTTSDL